MRPPRNKKIAILADALDNQRAGVHVFTKELVRALVELGKADQIVLVREKYDPSSEIEQIVVPNTRLPIGFASLRLFFILPWLLRKRGIVAVFEPAHFGPFNLPCKIKRMTMIHDLTPLIFPEYHRWHSQVLQRIFLKGILQKTDWVFTNSLNTSQDVQRIFPFTAKKISHLYLGKSELFRPVYDLDRIKTLGISRPYFLFVGTIEPRKGLLTLLAAYKTFCVENNKTPVQLVIGGQLGWKTAAFEEALRNHPYRDQIKRLGYVEDDDLPILYTHAKAFIYPSEYEGFGLPVIEALACGTDVITAKNSSLVEIGEGTAIFFDTHNSEDLTEKMELVYQSTADNTVRNQQHAAKFSWQQCAEEFWQKVEELTGE